MGMVTKVQFMSNYISFNVVAPTCCITIQSQTFKKVTHENGGEFLQRFTRCISVSGIIYFSYKLW